ncbi:MAG TPA: hypothetical protein VIL25_03800 [Vicinamibacterales bacterium]
MIRLRSLSLLLFVALLVPAARPVLRAQPDVEELARRQFESGLEFYRAGRYAEAMKDFQTVAEGYSESSVADDAMLAIAQYQLEVLRDAQAAKNSAETLVTRYATGDAAPMGYVISGRATLALDPSPAGMESAMASFERVPRLFPGSDAVAPALYYAAELDYRAGRPGEALDRLRRIATQYGRTPWAARAGLLESELVLASGDPIEAMRTLQRVVRGFGSGPEAAAARARNTILYRLYLRAPAQQPPYVASGRSIAGPGGRLRDVASIALAPDGTLGVAMRNGMLVLDEKGTLVRQLPATDSRQLSFDPGGRAFIVQKAIVAVETPGGLQRLALTAGAGAASRVLQDISAGARLSTGELIIADRDARSVSRFAPDGKFLNAIMSGRVRRIAVGRNDEMAFIDDDSKSVVWTDRTGKPLAKIPERGTGYQLNSPSDLAFDVFQHLYVLDRHSVSVFAPGGRHLATFSPSGQAAIRNGSALALDDAARLYIYDNSQDRVLIYQ